MSTKHLREIQDELADWESIGSVGRAIVYRDHMGNLALGVESVVKLHELTEEDQRLIKQLVQRLQAFKLRIICKGQGEPDRVEVYRQLI